MCPDGWPVTMLLTEGGGSCDLMDQPRQTWCASAGRFTIDLWTATGLPTLQCTVTDSDGVFSCEAHNGGAHWEDDAQATGTLGDTSLEGTWTFTTTSTSGADGSTNTCTSHGTLHAAVP